ncbi:MAG: DUF3109 family protein [Myxococcales bacterium]|jgi:hypothetical protein
MAVRSSRKAVGTEVAFAINPLVKKWLAGLDVDDSDDAPDLDAWRDRLKEAGRLIKVGPVEVDRAVLEQRFACVPERCSPSEKRGKSRCCCADLEVELTRLEGRQLDSFKEPLNGYMAVEEPRLEVAPGGKGRFWREEDRAVLCRPDGRCVFSLRDDAGRIRCHLHAFARKQGVQLSEVQPLTCRVFPLLLIVLGRGKLVLSVLAKHSFREVGSLHPRRFPCLSDPTLPPIYESLSADLDWMFGQGFAGELARLAAE